MSKKDKVIKKIKQNPSGVRFREIESLLLGLGFTKRQSGSSHCIYRKEDKIIMIVKPHKGEKFTALVDVKKVLKYLEEIGYV
jgi:predicted RNA binding protein YcfA (HicA-like mRNA interferase family)